MKINTITADAWLKAMVNAERKQPDDPGMTREEFGHKMGLAKTRAREVLRELFVAGKLICGKKRAPCMDGTNKLVPCYRLKK